MLAETESGEGREVTARELGSGCGQYQRLALYTRFALRVAQDSWDAKWYLHLDGADGDGLGRDKGRTQAITAIIARNSRTHRSAPVSS